MYFFLALMINHAVHLYYILYTVVTFYTPTHIYILFPPQNMTIKMRSMLYSDAGSNLDFDLSIILFGHRLYFLSLHFPIMVTSKSLISSVFSLKLQISKYSHFLLNSVFFITIIWNSKGIGATITLENSNIS